MMADFENRIFEKLDKLAETQSEILVEQAKHSERQKATYKAVGELKTDVKKQNGRVGKLENWRWYSIGLFTAIVGVVKLFWN